MLSMRQSECHQFAHSSSTTVPFQLCERIDFGYRGPIRKTAALLSSTTAIPVVFTVHGPNFDCITYSSSTLISGTCQYGCLAPLHMNTYYVPIG